MSFHALRRWLARHSGPGVLGLALGLAALLSGAQLVAACHEISHVAAAAREVGVANASTSTSTTASPSASDSSASMTSDAGDAHVGDGHDCPTCLLAAALGGAATAPPTPALHVAQDADATPPATATDFAPRTLRRYASRGPPAAATPARATA